MIDAAIHYANLKLRSDAMPRTVLQGRASISGRVRWRERQAELDELAKKLAKPES
ncbi:hypothetical protein I548_0012 [Mycobacterium intracellulare]|nr:hypothetical protein I548_0012 [Mycobacterium intracellulare]